MSHANGKETGRKQRIIHEVTEYLTNFVFLALIFVAFTWYRRLILAEYHIRYLHYGISVVEALVLAKIVMIGDIIGIGRKLEDRPLVFPTLYKAFTFSLWVAAFGLVEHILGGLVRGEGLTGGVRELASQGKYELLAKSLVMFFAFLPFFAFREIERVMGEGTLRRLFFRKRASAPPRPPDARTPHPPAD